MECFWVILVFLNFLIIERYTVGSILNLDLIKLCSICSASLVEIKPFLWACTRMPQVPMDLTLSILDTLLASLSSAMKMSAFNCLHSFNACFSPRPILLFSLRKAYFESVSELILTLRIHLPTASSMIDASVILRIFPYVTVSWKAASGIQIFP